MGLVDKPTGGGALLIGFNISGDGFETDLGVTRGLLFFAFTTGSFLAVCESLKSARDCVLAATCSSLQKKIRYQSKIMLARVIQHMPVSMPYVLLF